MNMRTYLSTALAGVFFIGMATAALAVTGQYDNMCAMGLASGKDINTDCSVNTQIHGKTYCFGNQSALTQFMADPSGNLAKAQAYYSKKHPG
jgi:YHS domain-containing protein